MGNGFPARRAQAVRCFPPGLGNGCHSIRCHRRDGRENHDCQDDTCCQYRKAKGHREQFPECRNEYGHPDKAIYNRRDTRKEFDSRLDQAASPGCRDFRHVDR